MNEKEIAIIGYGMIGRATALFFNTSKYFSRSQATITLEEAAKCKYIFICLPTPVEQDGSYYTRDIENIIKQIEAYGTSATYIIRSTVWPGFANYLMGKLGIDRIISNPEFLTESTWEEDIKNPPLILLGGENNDLLEAVKRLYQEKIKKIPFVLTDNTTAEMAKLAMNAYFTTKVVFANQLYDACQRLGVSYEKVKKTMENHPFGPRNHFTVWHKGGRGALGRCLWKDARAYTKYTNSDLMKKVITINEQLMWEYPKKE